MNKEELIGKLQMVYVGDKNALDELIGYYDGLKEVIEIVQQENEKLKADYGTQAQIERDLLKEENKILRENAENNDKVVDKVNWENQSLKKQLEEYKATNKILSHELTKDKVLQQDCLTTCCGIPIGKIPKLITQQKEFISYLENEKDRLARECCEQNLDGIISID